MNDDLTRSALEQIGLHYGIATLELDHEGATALRFEDDLQVTIRFFVAQERTQAAIAIPLAPLPQGTAMLSQELLNLNGRLFATQGASFAWDKNSGDALMLVRLEQLCFEPAIWPTLLDGLLSNARRWRGQMQRGDLALSLEGELEEALQRIL